MPEKVGRFDEVGMLREFRDQIAPVAQLADASVNLTDRRIRDGNAFESTLGGHFALCHLLFSRFVIRPPRHRWLRLLLSAPTKAHLVRDTLRSRGPRATQGDWAKDRQSGIERGYSEGASIRSTGPAFTKRRA